MEIELNGPSAVVGLVLIGVFGLYRLSAMTTELETEALEPLRAFLAAEYAGARIAELSEALDASARMDPGEAEGRTREILAAHEITFASVSARGRWDAADGGEVVVRVEIEVDGGPPPDGETVRYYRMHYRPLSGFRVGARTSAWSYRLALF